MPNDRDLAQQWLAERMWKRCPGCSDDSDGWSHVREAEANHLAAAILDTPGVEVAWEAVDSNGHLSVLFEPMPRNSRRVVIRLPYESAPRVAAHQHTEINEEQRP